MSLQARKELLFRMRSRYGSADRKTKSEILEGFVAATGYHRKYAVSVLSKPARDPSADRLFKERKRVYDEAVKQALVCIWNAANQICSKRLVPFLPDFIETLERFGHLSISPEVKSKLLRLSPASMDRLLRDERRSHPRGISTTKPANLLKQRIKVRTFAEWNESGPGFFEGDLVAHCGDRAEGSFLHSLVLTDIATGWTEFVPLLNKCDTDVTSGLDAIRSVLPIPLLGLDTDNGSEFINHELLAYCEKDKITFTRSRAYKKNDQAHIEQKNGSVVRRIVGYDRFEGVAAAQRLLELYQVLRLYVNHFQPSTKLLSKTRIGSRTKKQYDSAKTPFQRLLQSKHLSPSAMAKLKQVHAALDPIALFDQLGKLQQALWQTAAVEVPRNSVVQIKRDIPVSPSVTFTPALESLKPVRKYKRRYRVNVPHTWRTRKDPLEGSTDYAKLLFQLDPGITSTEMFAKLREQFPDRFHGGELKTVQRRLSLWRRESMRITTFPADPADSEYQAHLKELTAKALNVAVVSG